MPTDATGLSLIRDVKDLQRLLRRHRNLSVSGAPFWDYQEFTTAGPNTLRYLPINLSPHVELNGVGLREGTDYTWNYATGVLTLTATFTTGDHLMVRYQTTGLLQVAATTPDTGVTPPVFDAAAGAATTTLTTARTWTHTVTTAANRLMVVTFAGGSGAGTVTASVNSLSMTAGPTASTPTGSGKIVSFYMINPPTGSVTGQVSTGSGAQFTGISTSYSNVNQTTPLGTSGTSNSGAGSTGLSTTISALATDLILSTVLVDSTNTLTPAGSQTSRLTETAAATPWQAAVSTQPGATSVTSSWSWSSGPDANALVSIPIHGSA